MRRSDIVRMRHGDAGGDFGVSGFERGQDLGLGAFTEGVEVILFETGFGNGLGVTGETEDAVGVETFNFD